MRLLRPVLAALAAALVTLVPGPPALAHGGAITLDVAGDGAGGVTVRAVYEDDQHPVEEGLRLVLTATGEGGRAAGPIQLNPAAEGRGFYTSGAVLSPGRWTVTVAAPAPNAAKATATVDARVAEQPPPAPVAEARDNPLTGRFGWLWWLGGAVLVIAVLGAITQSRAKRHDRAKPSDRTTV